MTDFSGLNLFGSLTTSNGQKLTFKDFDLDGDGEITQEEYEQVIKDYDLDSVELSGVDTNDDKVISEDEFEIYDQKAQMQEALNDLTATISKDFTGTNSSYIADVISQLKDFAEDFASNYTGETSNIAETFKEQLPTKYEEIKTNILENSPSKVKSRVLDELSNYVTNTIESDKTIILSRNVAKDVVTSYNEETGSENHYIAGIELSESQQAIVKSLMQTLEASADSFISTYTGDNLENDLEEYLKNLLTLSDKDKMADAISAWDTGAASFGSYIDSGELDELKEYAKELLQAAIDNGLSITMNGTKVTSSNITSILSKYTDGDALISAVQTIIDGLSTASLIDSTIEQITSLPDEEAAAALQEAEAAFAALQGSDVQIDSTSIDFSAIDGYYDNKKVEKKSQSKETAEEQVVELLETNLKDQFEAQIKKTLEAKGISWEQFETTFENVFSTSAWEAAGECVSYRHATAFRSRKTTYYIQDAVNEFIEVFNKNIASAIDEMNASNTDMDLWDIDYSVLYTDDSGNVVDEDLEEKLASGKDIYVAVGTKDTATENGEEEAEAIIDKLKSTMLAKARAMCTVNDVEFDNDAFNTIFNNSKSYAASQAVSVKLVIGDIYRAKCNPQELVTTFTTSFKESYTTWVNKQKSSV